MTPTRTSILLSLSLGLLTTGACATTQPSPMLVDARQDYDKARNGPPGQFVPELVHEAKTALDKAERAHDRDPGSNEEEHLAYLAHRRTLLAVSAAEQRMAVAEGAKAKKAFETMLVSQRDDANDKAKEAGSDLADERTKRKSAEDAARRALARLAEMASVKTEAQRTIITLSGEVLFKSKEATLLPGAQSQLDLVAEALTSQGEKRMVVEGHTDSQGKDDYNQALSQRRADAVRSYLVSRGIAADLIQAAGKGELEPVADNKSAEGRANNRRVEIEIDNAPSTSAR
jgi:outer membrane protein OmpA-like peptidoglycan-associated protein